jgi:hypothetical protein
MTRFRVLTLAAAALVLASPRCCDPSSAALGGEFAALEEAVRQSPDDLASRRHLAEAYGQRGFIEEAVAEHVAILTRRQGDEEARARVAELVAQRMPAWLPADAPDVAPFPVAVCEVTLPGPGADEGPVTCRVLRTGAGFIAREGERRDPVHGWPFPVADYGYVWTPKTQRWVMRARLHRGPGVDERLADRALATLLCLQVAAWEYLHREPAQRPGRVVHIWVTREGEAGARAVGHDLYLHAVGVERSPGEWLREIAHEYGHMALPGIGGFNETDDPWADGYLAELLFPKWLAAVGADECSGWPMAEAERQAEPRRQELIAEALAARDGSSRLGGADDRSRRYFLGLALHVEAVAGPLFLGEALARCPRGRPAGFVAAADQLAARRGIALWGSRSD